jgi:Domain of unknown function (DUF4114)
MDFFKLLPALILTSVLFSCQKDKAPDSVPVEFTSTSYVGLAAYDTSGKPNNLIMPRDVVSPTMLTYITTTLPEDKDLRTTHPELLTTQSVADIKITVSSDVFITYVSNGAGFTNTFAFYTYPTGQSPTKTTDIQKITFVFPNAGGGTPLVSGDKVKIGRFSAGTSIGFVLLQNGWDEVLNTVDNRAVHFLSNDALNPEVSLALKKHAVLINYAPENKVLIGFEDLNRTLPECDHDFNDVVFFATVTP